MYDDERLDPRSLSFQGPGAATTAHSVLAGRVSNSPLHRRGGPRTRPRPSVCPHDCQRKAERAPARIIAHGRRETTTYGQERRGEGARPHFSVPPAPCCWPTAVHFAGEQADARTRPTCRFGRPRLLRSRIGKLVLTGAVVCPGRPPFGIAAMDDWAKIPADYGRRELDLQDR